LKIPLSTIALSETHMQGIFAVIVHRLAVAVPPHTYPSCALNKLMREEARLFGSKLKGNHIGPPKINDAGLLISDLL